MRNGAPFVELPPAFRALQQRMLKTPGGDREMVEILALVLQHDEQAVLAAVELTLEAGAPTKTHILNLLHRLVDGKPIAPPAVKPPNALTLTTEQQANVERYDVARASKLWRPCLDWRWQLRICPAGSVSLPWRDCSLGKREVAHLPLPRNAGLREYEARHVHVRSRRSSHGQSSREE